MSLYSRWSTLPIISFFIAEWQLWRKEQAKPCYRLVSILHDASRFLPYPMDFEALLTLPHGTLDESGVPYNAPTGLYPAAYHPTTIAQYALANWNAYLRTGDEKFSHAFMTQAHWLLEHEEQQMGRWSIPFSVIDYNASTPWCSALTQGNVISVLVRANQLTDDEVFLQAARRGVLTFELDIKDGGVSTTVGEEGVFFEEFAVYPPSHVLNGYILSLFGLYDYVAVAGDAQIDSLIRRSLATFHKLIEQYDTGNWSRYDLLYKQRASRFYHALHITLLTALAQYSGCDHCANLAARWAKYKYSPLYHIENRLARAYHKFQRTGIRGIFLSILKRRKQMSSRSLHTPSVASQIALLQSADRKAEG